MNRLGKVLTLGLEKKRAWQLPIIAALLVLFALGVRWWYNSRAAKGVRLLDMVDINDVDGVRWICRWDKEQVNKAVAAAPRNRYWDWLGLRLLWASTWTATPLQYACGSGYAEITETLIRAGADVEQVDQYGWTPLHLAAGAGDVETVEVLIRHGADVNVHEDDSKRRAEREMAMVTTSIGDWYTRTEGATPLHFAAREGHVDIVRALIGAGADLNITDYYGFTPLKLAMSRRWAAVAQLLRKHGAKTGAELDAEAKQGKAEKAKKKE